MAEKKGDGDASSFADALVRESPDALIALAPDGRILFWSRGARSIFGYGEEEAVGRSLEDLVVPPDRRDEGKWAIDQAIRTGAAVFETVRIRKDGSRVDVDVT